MPLEGFTVDASDLEHLALKLRHAASHARVEVDKTLAGIGEEIVASAKGIADEHSTRISQTIHSEAMPGAVRITAGSADTPIAALYELGNKGGRRTSPTFRHPVFGRDVWVEQPRYRFLAPARTRLRQVNLRQLTEAWERAMRSSGIHVPSRR